MKPVALFIISFLTTVILSVLSVVSVMISPFIPLELQHFFSEIVFFLYGMTAMSFLSTIVLMAVSLADNKQDGGISNDPKPSDPKSPISQLLILISKKQRKSSFLSDKRNVIIPYPTDIVLKK